MNDQLRGALLAARTMEHYVCNQLTTTAAHAALLAEDPVLPERARAQARAAVRGAEAAVATIRQLRQITSLHEQVAWPGCSIIDIERSLG